MRILGLQKISLIDYPGKVCSVIFLSKCNFRCGYCHNPELVFDIDLPEIKEEEVMKVLDERKGFIDGVCITGGEPTLHKELPDLIRKIRGLGFKVKLDTNGSNPKMLQDLIEKRLVDFIAMDVKNVFERYEETTNSKVSTEVIKESIKTIISSGIEHEFRTTVLPKFHKKEDIVEIAKDYLKGAKKYVLQQFMPSEKMLDKSLLTEKRFSEKDLKTLREECNKYINTEIRNL